MAVPMASFARVVTFGSFKRCVASFRAASVALCVIPTFFITCPKSLCVAGAIPLRRSQKMSCIRHFAWQQQHFRHVVLRAFANRIVRAA